MLWAKPGREFNPVHLRSVKVHNLKQYQVCPWQLAPLLLNRKLPTVAYKPVNVLTNFLEHFNKKTFFRCIPSKKGAAIYQAL